jgi:hypothetical protein
MAVVNRDGKKQETESDFIEIDVEQILSNSAELPEGKKHKLDASAADDAWDFGAPPPKGHYDLSIAFSKPSKNTSNAGIRYNKEEDYYVIGFECRTVNHSNTDYNNIPVFAGVSTKIGRGKVISTAAALLVKMGVKIPDELTDKQVVQLWSQLMKRNPICRQCLLDWRGGYKDGKSQWQNVFQTMEDFPVDKTLEDGTIVYNYLPMVTNNMGGQTEVRAQLYVSEWGASSVDKINHKKEVVSTKGKNVVSANGQVVMMPASNDAPTFLTGAVTQTVNTPNIKQEDPLDLEFMIDK